MSTSPGSSRKRKASDLADNESNDPRRRPEIPASPKPTTRTLMDLPPELKNQILDYLTPNPPEIGESAPEAYDKLVREDPWYDFTRRRSALRNLCLASHFWANLARPYLYNTIAITSEEVLVLLFRTITENPEYCAWTRFISCHLTLTNARVIRKTKRCLNKLLPTWREGKGLEFVAGYLGSLHIRSASTIPDHYYEMPQGILTMTITALYKLETLLLQVPAIEDDLDYFELLSCLRVALSYFDTAEGQKCRDYFAFMSADATLPADAGAAILAMRRESDALIPFQHLTTLLLQGDPSVEDPTSLDEDDWDGGDPPEVFGVQTRNYHSLFDLLPALTTVEVSTDDGIFSLLENDDDLTDFLHVPITTSHLQNPAKHVYLHASVADPRNIGRILRHAPNLETLYMQPRRVDSFHRIPPQDATIADEDCLDQALAKYGKKLKHLDLNWFDCQGSEASIGVGGRLSTLPLLPGIEKLCLQLVLLYGDLPAGEQMMQQTPIADLLPPNLVDLTLEDWWWESLDDFDTFYRWSDVQRETHYKEKQEYRQTVLGMMRDLASVCGKNATPNQLGNRKMQKLKKVRFFVRTLPTWIPLQINEEDDCLDRVTPDERELVIQQFADVKELFEKAGVEFEVEVDQPLEVMEMMEEGVID